MYEISNGGNYLDFEVFIGIFNSKEKSEEAVKIILSYGFFKDRVDSFEYSGIELDKVGWSDGFASWGDGDWEENEE